MQTGLQKHWIHFWIIPRFPSVFCLICELLEDSANTLALWENVVPKVGSTTGATSSAMELPHIFRRPVAKVRKGYPANLGMYRKILSKNM